MIELFKIIKGIYDPTWVPHFDFYRASYALAVYAMVVCLSVSVCHKSVFY